MRPPCPNAAAMTTAERSAGAAEGRAGLLSGKVCVVSGVGPGLGRQAAKALAAHGADLVLAARRQSTLDDVLAEVSGARGAGHLVPTDITDPEACAASMAAAVEEFGGIDVLVNNAFRFDAFQSFEEVDLALAQDHGHQPLRLPADDPGRAAGHARAAVAGPSSWWPPWSTRQPQPAQGGYAISKGASAHRDKGARL